MDLQYRALAETEILQLESANCQCSDWNRVHVAKDFDINGLRNVQFGGDVKIGTNSKPVSFVDEFEVKCGIFNSTIYNCTIGDNVYISNVHTLANYNIGDDCILTDITSLTVQGQSCFGNGVELCVVNEGGGREIKIYDLLSAQIGYILANYRHLSGLISAFENNIDNYIKSITSNIGAIGTGTRIVNCGTLKDVKIGSMAILEGVTSLENGSINSTAKASVKIGANVVAKDFIICSGSEVLDNVILDKVFVGQGCELSKGFSAENSVFFANCSCYHGEACSAFAGPFTVSHHKGSILLAAVFSFFNAGSTSNQSNHMYKLGAVHQAIFERGCKFGSGAHVVYPARLGLFNVILGKHESNPDTRDLPFSYVLQSGNQTLIVPGYNLQSSGTLRDINKWPDRDARTDDIELDNITFESMNPYTAIRMLNGIKVLEELIANSLDTDEWVDFQKCKIKRKWAKDGITYYRLALDAYFGLKYAMRKIAGKSVDPSESYYKDWADVGGMVAPLDKVQEICDEIESGELADVQQVASVFISLSDSYQELEWSWICDKIKDLSEKEILSNWKQAFEKNSEMIIEDAKKEFNDSAKIPYGIDSVRGDADEDFQAVRGTLEGNSFIKKLKRELEEKRRIAAKLGV